MMESRAQSAMEYLMTYGWAILIILVVLGVLYLLGVFTPGRILGSNCSVTFKYVCTNLVLSTNGTMSFLLGQNTGSTEYNIGVACTAGANATGGPLSNVPPWVYLNADGLTESGYNAASAYFLESGTTVQINNTPCYSATGALLDPPLGASFSGILWLRYTLGTGTAGTGSNPWLIARIATFSTTVGLTGSAPPSSNTVTTTTNGMSSTATTTIPQTFATAAQINSGPQSGVSLNVTPQKYQTYLCAGAIDGQEGPLSIGWSTDVQDSVSSGPYSNIGHSSNGCSASETQIRAQLLNAPGTNITIAAIGLNSSPSYTSYTNTDSQSDGYTVVNLTGLPTNSFVVLMGVCGEGYDCGSLYSLPSGCTQSQSMTDAYGDSAYIATCEFTGLLGPGNFNFTYADHCVINPRLCARIGKLMPTPNPIDAAAYVFPNYTPSGS